jgi:hypothetical protein
MSNVVLQQELPGIVLDEDETWPPRDVPKRIQVRPLREAALIYAALSALTVGQWVPPEVYICDYDAGGIPPWMLKERKDLGGPYHTLTVIDASTQHERSEGTGWVARDVFCCPTKVLATPLYTYYAGCVHEFGMLEDIQQRARQIADRQQAQGERDWPDDA